MPGKIHPLGHELLDSNGEQVRELEPVPPGPEPKMRRVKARKIIDEGADQSVTKCNKLST